MYRPRFTVTPTLLHNIEQIGRSLGLLKVVRLPTAFAQALIAQVEM